MCEPEGNHFVLCDRHLCVFILTPPRSVTVTKASFASLVRATKVSVAFHLLTISELVLVDFSDAHFCCF